MKFKKPIAIIGISVLAALGLASCRDAEVVDYNVTKDAENFKIERRIVFFNGITDKYLLTIEGRCNLKDADGQLEVICKTGEKSFKKSFLGLSDNVTYFAEQTEPIEEDPFHYEIMFKPETIIPHFELRTSDD